MGFLDSNLAAIINPLLLHFLLRSPLPFMRCLMFRSHSPHPFLHNIRMQCSLHVLSFWLTWLGVLVGPHWGRDHWHLRRGHLSQSRRAVKPVEKVEPSLLLSPCHLLRYLSSTPFLTRFLATPCVLDPSLFDHPSFVDPLLVTSF